MIWWVLARVRQKESLGEYGSGWGWDGNTPHVFDYTQIDEDIPMRYDNPVSTLVPIPNDAWIDYGSATSSAVKYPYCGIEQTDGILLTSGSQFMNNISCNPHSYNAGNYYNFPAVSISGLESTKTSICPKGWYLPNKIDGTSYSNILTQYGINVEVEMLSNHDTGLLNLPLSFLRTGRYITDASSLRNRNTDGYYYMTKNIMWFYYSGYVGVDYNGSTSIGYSLRSGEKIIYSRIAQSSQYH